MNPLNKKKLTIIMILVCLMLALSGCSPNPKNFTCRDMTVTLNQDFSKKDEWL